MILVGTCSKMMRQLYNINISLTFIMKEGCGKVGRIGNSGVEPNSPRGEDGRGLVDVSNYIAGSTYIHGYLLSSRL